MSLANACAEIYCQYYHQIRRETWGHLAPKPNKKYKLEIVIACSEYSSGEVVVVKTEGDVPDSPWFFEDMNIWMRDISKEHYDKEEGVFISPKIKEGTVHRFIGTYVKYKNGNYKFLGQLTEIKI